MTEKESTSLDTYSFTDMQGDAVVIRATTRQEAMEKFNALKKEEKSQSKKSSLSKK